MHVEPLEGRRLLTATLAGGVLTVTGDAGNNHVVVVLRAGGTEGDELLVFEGVEAADTGTGSAELVTPALSRRQRQHRRRGGGALRRIRVPRPRLGGGTTTEFSAASVTSISIDLGAGNDSASLHGVTQPTTISGGDGNDLLFGGPAADTLNGDAGNDTLNSFRGGKDTVNGGTNALVNGESGDIAFVDATSATDEGTGEVTEADVVTNVEAIRSGRGHGGGFGEFHFRGSPPAAGFVLPRPTTFGPLRPFGRFGRR